MSEHEHLNYFWLKIMPPKYSPEHRILGTLICEDSDGEITHAVIDFILKLPKKPRMDWLVEVKRPHQGPVVCQATIRQLFMQATHTTHISAEPMVLVRRSG